MRCPRCDHENPSAHRFCADCGEALARPCPQCGAACAPRERFCGECGTALHVAEHRGQGSAPTARPPTPDPGKAPLSYTPKHLADKILAARGAVEGERKQVTVLFADVKGSLDLAEQLDPEEWHGILDRFFQILSDGVHRFEGTVNQYTGDGIMALFGAPIAHEDHAQRACYAALQLGEALRRHATELRLRAGLNFSARIGINSGEVVVGKIGDDLRMDYTAQGHTVGLAARMEQIAEPGKTYLTEYTANRVQGFFQLADLGRLHIKGARNPVRVFELQGIGRLSTRFEASRARGLSRFVGRADEMQALEAALARAQAGQPQVVGVVSEAGLGKSRLCYEFLKRCRARGLMTYEASGVAHGKAIPFLPVLQLVRSFFGITEQDSAPTARERIAGRLLLLDDKFRASLPLAFDFLGVSDPEQPSPRMDPDARQRQLHALVREVTHARGQRETTVTLLEDLHWFDAGSEALLEPLLDVRPGTRALAIVNFRPEYHAAWMAKSYYQQLPVLPLGQDAIRQLLDDLLGNHPSLVGLEDAIYARTDGNPFFSEEVVQALIESGRLQGRKGEYRLVAPIDRIEVPATVQSVLAARIDRLGARDKQVLQTAAVIGREFSEPVLAAVLELPAPQLAEALQALKDAEFVYEQALYPVAEYAFKHPLTQEVALGSQLQERRKRTHAAVARALEATHAGDLDEHAALLAHHWEEAGEAMAAVQWYRRAAQWLGASDLAECMRLWRKVHALLGSVPRSTETTPLRIAACWQILGYAFRVGLTDEEADALFRDGKALAEQTGDLASLSNLLSAFGSLRGVHGRVDEYLALSREAARLAEQVGDAGLCLARQVNLSYASFLAGRLADAVALTSAVVQLPPETVSLGAELGISPYTWCIWFRGFVLSLTGRLAEGRPEMERALALARKRGDNENLGWIHTLIVWSDFLRGETHGCLEHAGQAVDLAERVGSAFSRVFAYDALGLAHNLNGQWLESVASFEQSLAIAREKSTALEGEAGILAHFAEALAGLGDAVRARATAEEAVALSRRRHTPFHECIARLALARVLLRTAGPREQHAARGALAGALARVRDTGAASFEPLIRVERAELARLTGEEGAREQELHAAHRLFLAIGAPRRAEQVAAELQALRMPARPQRASVGARR